MRHTRTTKLVATAAIAAITIAACGSDSDEGAADEAEPEADVSDEEAPPAEAEEDAAAVDDDAMEEDSMEEDSMEEDSMEEDDGAMMEEGSMAGPRPSTSPPCAPPPSSSRPTGSPKSEHGALYEMVGEGATIDAETKIVTGPLVQHGGARPASTSRSAPVARRSASSRSCRSWPRTTTSRSATSPPTKRSRTTQTTPPRRSSHPSRSTRRSSCGTPRPTPTSETIADLATAKDGEGVTIRYFETGAYMQYLLSDGQVTDAQLDGSYDGGPSVFIAEGGAIAQQGFASAEPYNYENVFEDWGKPV